MKTMKLVMAAALLSGLLSCAYRQPLMVVDRSEQEASEQQFKQDKAKAGENFRKQHGN